MGIACSPDIFHTQMSEMMVTLKFIQAYINDLLCITKGSLEDHLMQALTRLRCEGLKVIQRNTPYVPQGHNIIDFFLPEMTPSPGQRRYIPSLHSHHHRN
jgi:hypothetical protein